MPPKAMNRLLGGSAQHKEEAKKEEGLMPLPTALPPWLQLNLNERKPKKKGLRAAETKRNRMKTALKGCRKSLSASRPALLMHLPSSTPLPGLLRCLDGAFFQASFAEALVELKALMAQDI